MVQTDTLKDSQSRTIGYIETDSRGKQTARTNWTVDRNNCRVSSGNTLMALLLQG
jgi:hypothetical protein